MCSLIMHTESLNLLVSDVTCLKYGAVMQCGRSGHDTEHGGDNTGLGELSVVD